MLNFRRPHSRANNAARPFFSPDYYRRKIPVWVTYDDMRMLGEAGSVTPSPRQLVARLLLGGLLLGMLGAAFVRPKRRRPRL